jgi:myo-inositol-1(or 4)-monophosphatase
VLIGAALATRYRDRVTTGGGPTPRPAGVAALAVLHAAVDAVADALAGLDDWGLAGTRDGQYRSDLVADAAALAVIERAGFGAVSEESGVHNGDRDVVVVVDPVDGSTNAAHGLPWWATSVCAVDREGPVAAVVANQATAVRFEAVRGGGARRTDRPGAHWRPVEPSSCERLGDAIVGCNGWPSRRLGWRQYRALGAAALDLCAVASGALDAYFDCDEGALAPWDYLGALLVCREAGAAVGELAGRDLTVTDQTARRAPVAAATPQLLRQLTETLQENTG